MFETLVVTTDQANTAQVLYSEIAGFIDCGKSGGLMHMKRAGSWAISLHQEDFKMASSKWAAWLHRMNERS